LAIVRATIAARAGGVGPFGNTSSGGGDDACCINFSTADPS